MRKLSYLYVETKTVLGQWSVYYHSFTVNFPTVRQSRNVEKWFGLSQNEEGGKKESEEKKGSEGKKDDPKNERKKPQLDMTAVVVATVLGGLLTMYMMPDLNEEITTAEFITSYVASRQVSVIWVTVVLPQNIVPQNGDRRPGPKHLAPEHYAPEILPQ